MNSNNLFGINRSPDKKNSNIINALERARPLKIWVGTFNMAFKDFQINEQNLNELSQFIPVG